MEIFVFFWWFWAVKNKANQSQFQMMDTLKSLLASAVREFLPGRYLYHPGAYSGRPVPVEVRMGPDPGLCGSVPAALRGSGGPRALRPVLGCPWGERPVEPGK